MLFYSVGFLVMLVATNNVSRYKEWTDSSQKRFLVFDNHSVYFSNEELFIFLEFFHAYIVDTMKSNIIFDQIQYHSIDYIWHHWNAYRWYYSLSEMIVGVITTVSTWNNQTSWQIWRTHIQVMGNSWEKKLNTRSGTLQWYSGFFR